MNTSITQMWMVCHLLLYCQLYTYLSWVGHNNFDTVLQYQHKTSFNTYLNIYKESVLCGIVDTTVS